MPGRSNVCCPWVWYGSVDTSTKLNRSILNIDMYIYICIVVHKLEGLLEAGSCECSQDWPCIQPVFSDRSGLRQKVTGAKAYCLPRKLVKRLSCILNCTHVGSRGAGLPCSMLLNEEVQVHR